MTFPKLLPLFLLLPPLFSQGNQNNVQLGVVDASASAWKFPTRLFANLPAFATSTGQRFTVTDCLTSACTAGSGTLRQDMVSTGAAWVPAISLADGTGGVLYVVSPDTTTTHALFATAGAPAFRALALTDLPSGTAQGTGTLNVLPRWSNTTGGLQDSAVTDNGTDVLISRPVLVNTTSDLGAMLTVLDTRSTSPRGILSWQASTDTQGARVGFAKARGTASSPTIVVSGDMIGRDVFRAYDGANYLEMASVDVGTQGTIAATRVPTYMAFSTATDATPSVLTERLRIIANGNVGIGITAPAYSLDVSRGVGLTGTARFFDQTATTGTTLVTITPGAGQTSASVTQKNGGLTNSAGYQVLAVSAQNVTQDILNDGNDNLNIGRNAAGKLIQIGDNGTDRGLTISSAGVLISNTRALQQTPRSTDPTCSTTADIGKFWFDNTTTTTARKACNNVAGTLTWVAF